jgi:hypothetical protein
MMLSDCSAQEPYNGNFEAAMKGIKAKALVLPGKTDLYFRKASPATHSSLLRLALLTGTLTCSSGGLGD